MQVNGDVLVLSGELGVLKLPPHSLVQGLVAVFGLDLSSKAIVEKSTFNSRTKKKTNQFK